MNKKTTTAKPAKVAKAAAPKKCACKNEKPAAAKTVKAVAKPAAKRTVKAATTKSVTFSLVTDVGSEVFVAGSFNEWNPTALKLVDKDGKGAYSATIKLESGEYEYKFIINGEWAIDPNCKEWRVNCFDTMNSVLRV